ncbi:MAG: SDR family oxidoreductase [Chlorobi bacterium]|nr:SDR family oxidoreductase [Chlorobiota bacterium]
MRVLVTGSTDGIGRETVKELASLGHNVVVHGRSSSRVGSVVEKIREDYPDVQCNGVVADFSSLKDVERMADEILHRGLIPDVLINNAGIIEHNFKLSADGYELTFAVNHLAHFYLTLLLMKHLPEKARIINVSSMIHSDRVNISTLNDEEAFDGIEAYSHSKLCNILFTYKLHRYLNGDRNITVNALHPGVINTKVLINSWGPIGSPVREGAKMSVYLAISPDVKDISGAYFSDGKQQKSKPGTYDERLQDECWNKSTEMIRKAGFAVSDRL